MNYFFLLSLLFMPEIPDKWNRHTIDDQSQGADGVRLADFNGDGLLDVVTGWEEGGIVRVYQHPSPKMSKKLWPKVTVGKVPQPEDAVFIDLDGDNILDVISCCEGRKQSINLHWAPKGKEHYFKEDRWVVQELPASKNVSRWMFALPLSDQGEKQAFTIVGSKNPKAQISLLFPMGDIRDLNSWKIFPIFEAGWIMSLQAIDMDRDGDMDVLASDRKGKSRSILWLENPGIKKKRNPAAWKTHRLLTGKEFMFLNHGDLNKDGLIDIVCAVKGAGIQVLIQNEKAETPWKHFEIPMPKNCGTGKGVAIGDMNLDGKNDIVFSCEGATGAKSGLRWLAQPKKGLEGVWKDYEISGPKGVKFDRIELLDIDRDGDLDVMTCEERDGLGVIWYENPQKSS